MDTTARLNIFINSDEGRKELYQLDKAYQQVTKKLAELTKAGKENSKASEALRKKQDELRVSLEEQKRQIGITALSYAELRKQYQSLRAEWGKAIPGSPERKKLEQEILAVQKQIDKVNFSAKDCHSIFAKGINGINKYAGALIVIYGALRKLGVELPDIRQNIIDFDKTFRQTLGLLSDADKNLYAQSLKKGQIELIRQYGVEINDVNKALFDTISAGIPAADATKFMNEAMRLSVGGATDLSVSVDGLTSVMNAYGIETKDTEKVSSAFFTAQKYGKTTVADLASNIGKVAPVAKSSGVAMEELMSVLAVITTKGIKTAEATTGLKAALAALLKPSKEAEEVLRSYNVPVGATEIAAAGLGKTLSALNDMYRQNKDALSAAIPSVEAYNIVAALTGDTLNFYDKVLQDVIADTGESSSLQKAYADNMESLEMRTKRAAGELRAYILENETLKNIYLALIKGTTSVIKFLVEHEGAVKRLILAVIAYRKAQDAGNMLLKVTQAESVKTALSINGLKTAFQGLTLAMKKNPLGAIISLAVMAAYPILEKLISKLGDTVQKMEQVKNLSEELADATHDEVTQVRVLYSVVKNNNALLDDRQAALARLKELVPGYLGYLTKEGVLMRDNSRAITEYIDQLNDMAYTRLLAEKYAEASLAYNEADIKVNEIAAKINNEGWSSFYDSEQKKAEKERAEAGKEKERIEALQKKFNDEMEAARKTREANMKRQLKTMFDEEELQWMNDMDLLEEMRRKGELSEDEYRERSMEREKKWLEDRASLYDRFQEKIGNKSSRKTQGKDDGLSADPMPDMMSGTGVDSHDSTQENRRNYEQSAEALEQVYERMKLNLRKFLIDKSITQQEFDDASLIGEELYYKALLDLQKSYGQDTIGTENKLLDIREVRQKSFSDRMKDNNTQAIKERTDQEKKALEEWIKNQEKAFIKLENQHKTFLDQLIENWGTLEEWAEKSGNPYAKMVMDMRDQMVLVKDAFNDMKRALKTGDLGESIEEIAAFAAQTITSIGTSLNQILEAENQVALKQEEARYNTAKSNLENYYSQAIEAAAGNEEEQQRLREEYDQKKRMLDYQTAVNKLEIEKKQAKASYNINLAMATAQAAAAIVQVFATVPFPASIAAAAIVAAATALQIRAMKAQRDAILSQTIEAPNLSSSASSNSSSASTGTSREITPLKQTEYVRGYEDGGYTDVTRAQDGRHFRAKVNPYGRGYIDGPELLVGESGREFVANAEAVSNPHIRPVFDIIDQAQRRGTVSRLNMRAIARSLGGIRARGYAAGGYTGGGAGGLVYGDTGPMLDLLGQIHDDILQVKDAIRTDHRAYVVLSDIHAMQQKLDVAKNLARL